MSEFGRCYKCGGDLVCPSCSDDKEKQVDVPAMIRTLRSELKWYMEKRYLEAIVKKVRDAGYH